MEQHDGWNCSRNIRGSYFSLRTAIANLVLLISSFIAAGILQTYTKNIFLGFAIIFAGAMIFRFFSAYFLSQMIEPPFRAPATKQPSIFKLGTTLGSTNVGRFILYNCLIQFTSNFASPFFSVYMIRDLKFSYLTYILITATGTLATLAFMPFWGKRIDRFGSIKVLQLASIVMPIGPLMWLFSHNVLFLCGAQVLGGFSWGGYNLVMASSFITRHQWKTVRGISPYLTHWCSAAPPWARCSAVSSRRSFPR